MEIYESYQAGFRPSLKNRRLDPAHRLIIRQLHLPNVGTPAPTNQHRLAAYWRGDFNRNKEAPVLAVTVPLGQRISNNDSGWHFGILGHEQFVASDDVGDACMEVAEYSAQSIVIAPDGLHAMLGVMPDPQDY